MKIILGIDDSPHSHAALEWVRNMQWPQGSQLIILSTVELYAYAMAEPGGLDVYDRVLADQMQAREGVVAEAERELQHAGLVVSSRVMQGDPRMLIPEIAHKERADLIVVGSHGRTGLPKLIMGSVASHILSHAPCNVLVVKHPRTPAGVKEQARS